MDFLKKCHWVLTVNAKYFLQPTSNTATSKNFIPIIGLEKGTRISLSFWVAALFRLGYRNYDKINKIRNRNRRTLNLPVIFFFFYTKQKCYLWDFSLLRDKLMLGKTFKCLKAISFLVAKCGTNISWQLFYVVTCLALMMLTLSIQGNLKVSTPSGFLPVLGGKSGHWQWWATEVRERWKQWEQQLPC